MKLAIQLVNVHNYVAIHAHAVICLYGCLFIDLVVMIEFLCNCISIVGVNIVVCHEFCYHTVYIIVPGILGSIKSLLSIIRIACKHELYSIAAMTVCACNAK